MLVFYQHMAPATRVSWMGISFPAQQSVRSGRGAMGSAAEFDATEIAFGTFLAVVGLVELLSGSDGGYGGSSCLWICSRETWVAQARSSFSYTEKPSLPSSGFTSGAAISFTKNLPISYAPTYAAYKFYTAVP